MKEHTLCSEGRKGRHSVPCVPAQAFCSTSLSLPQLIYLMTSVALPLSVTFCLLAPPPHTSHACMPQKCLCGRQASELVSVVFMHALPLPALP